MSDDPYPDHLEPNAALGGRRKGTFGSPQNPIDPSEAGRRSVEARKARKLNPPAPVLSSDEKIELALRGKAEKGDVQAATALEKLLESQRKRGQSNLNADVLSVMDMLQLTELRAAIAEAFGRPAPAPGEATFTAEELKEAEEELKARRRVNT